MFRFIGIIDLDQLDAEYKTDQIIKHFFNGSYYAEHTRSQNYDEASVMSKLKGVDTASKKTW